MRGSLVSERVSIKRLTRLKVFNVKASGRKPGARAYISTVAEVWRLKPPPISRPSVATLGQQQNAKCVLLKERFKSCKGCVSAQGITQRGESQSPEMAVFGLGTRH